MLKTIWTVALDGKIVINYRELTPDERKLLLSVVNTRIERFINTHLGGYREIF